MAGSSGKPVVEKLGIKPGFFVSTAGAPRAYGDIVGKLPAGVTIAATLKAPLDMVHVFAMQVSGLAAPSAGGGIGDRSHGECGDADRGLFRGAITQFRRLLPLRAQRESHEGRQSPGAAAEFHRHHHFFVSIFGAALGPMFGIMVADYYQQVVLEDLYTMSPDGSLHYDGGWNRTALVALAISGVGSIGLSLGGAYGVIPNIGDWGWLIGSSLGAVLYTALMRREAPVLSPPGSVVP